MLADLPSELLVTKVFPHLPVCALARLAVISDSFNLLVALAWADQGVWYHREQELALLLTSVLEGKERADEWVSHDLAWIGTHENQDSIIPT